VEEERKKKYGEEGEVYRTRVLEIIVWENTVQLLWGKTIKTEWKMIFKISNAIKNKRQ
jgi:hypothetical protein